MKKETAIGAVLSAIVAAVVVITLREDHHREVREREVRAAFYAGATIAINAIELKVMGSTNSSRIFETDVREYFKSKGLQP